MKCRSIVFVTIAPAVALPVPRDMTETRSGIPDRVPRSALLDIAGRKVMDLQPGVNVVKHLSPGVCFVRDGQTAVSRVAIVR